MSGVDDIKAKAVELLVERVAAQFESGVDNLSRAITNITVPYTIGDDLGHPNKITFTFEQLVKLSLYRRVRGLSQKEVITRVERQPYLRQRFNFHDTVPRQQTLSNAETDRFPDDTDIALDIAARGIAQEAVNHHAIVHELAPALLGPDDGESDDEPSQREYKRTQSQKSLRLARRHAIPHFETDRAANKSYSDEDIFEVLARMCATTGSANSEGEYGWLTDDDYTPDGSTILRAIKQFGTPTDDARQLAMDDFAGELKELPEIAAIRDAAVTAFDVATDNIIASIKGDTPFSDRETIAAIDITYERIYIPPWEDRDQQIPNPRFPKMASGYKKDDDPDDDKAGEIRHGFKYATITLVGDNVPIILGVEPVKENSNWESEDAMSYALGEIVDRLLTKAQRFVNIDTVLFDRGFYAHAVFDTVDRHGVTYITPKKTYENDYEDMDNIEEKPGADAAVHHDVTLTHEGRTHDLNLVFVPSREEEGKYAVFATNQQVETDEIDTVVNKYRRRWDIENQFKNIKDFLPRTSSMDYRVRFTKFVFATLIYNLWRLTDYLVKRALEVPIREEPVVGSRTFVRAIGNFLRAIG